MSNQKLYDRDFNLWIESQAIALKDKNLEAIDWDNLIEEIESMGASDKRALKSYFLRLVEHIFKLRDWEQERDRNKYKWRVEIRNFRREIELILEDSPSLNNYLKDNYSKWFDKAIRDLKKDRLFEISDTSLLNLNDILNKDY